MEKPIIYLDTKHISRLARHPDESAVAEVLAVLRSGEAELGLSIFHLIELSNPTFLSRSLVGTLLDSIGTRWATMLPMLFEAEIDAAFASALGTPRPVRAFWPTMANGFGLPPEAQVSITDALDVMASNPELRIGMERQAKSSVHVDQMKSAAAIVRRPREPLEVAIRDRGLKTTANGLIMPVPYPPSEIIKRAGGIPGFPAYHIYHSLIRIRMGDSRFTPEPNDIIDEWHACHGPYVQVLAIDRPTKGRIASAKLPLLSYTTSRLEEVVPYFAKELRVAKYRICGRGRVPPLRSGPGLRAQ